MLASKAICSPRPACIATPGRPQGCDNNMLGMSADLRATMRHTGRPALMGSACQRGLVLRRPRACARRPSARASGTSAHGLLGCREMHGQLLTQRYPLLFRHACAASPSPSKSSSSSGCRSGSSSSSSSISSSRSGRTICRAQLPGVLTSLEGWAASFTRKVTMVVSPPSRRTGGRELIDSDSDDSSAGISDEEAGRAAARRRDRAEAADGAGAIRVGWASIQGLREEMEDDVAVVADAGRGFTYAAVFDGHMGLNTVNFVKEELYKECMEELRGGELLEAEDLEEAEEALERAFLQTDERLLEWLAEDHPEVCESGSTATAVFARRDRVFVAHIGDSRAVLSLGLDVEEVSEDHRPRTNTSMGVAETERIKEAGGWVRQGRVCGVLAVSRAFGNIRFKTLRHEMLQEGLKKGRFTKGFISKLKLDSEWVSALPDVYAAELPDSAEFLVIASDGLWDAVSSKEAMEFVRQALAVHGDVQVASEELAHYALKERKSDDNISVVIVGFR